MTRRESNPPIGVFDSGVGGLTVARAIADLMPFERILYIADQAHVPYGGRRLEEVASFAEKLTEFLIRSGAKAVVMACNISSATALDALRHRFGTTRVFGVIEPGARSAIACAKAEAIGVLATQGTVATHAYRRAFERLAPSRSIQAIEVACPEFVPLVEAGDFSGPAAVSAAKRALAPILAAGADTAVLGCTHYPFLLPALKEAAPHLGFVDPAQATAREVAQVIDRATCSQGQHEFLTTGDPEIFRGQLETAFPDAGASVRGIDWGEIRIGTGTGTRTGTGLEAV